jgi:predicted nucleic acid-binding protein
VIVLDTSGLLAALDADQRHHEPARAVLAADPGPLLLSPFVLAELDYLLATRVSSAIARALLSEVADGAYQLEPFGREDIHAVDTVLDRYAHLELGLADASIVVLADRHGVSDVLTLDERHFRAIRTARGEAVRLLPMDRLTPVAPHPGRRVPSSRRR